jgi:hypothetical protein
VFGLGQGQPEMLDALVLFVEGDNIGDGFFITLIVTHDELQFDTHRGASPGSSGRGRKWAVLPDFCDFPQHLPALKEHYPERFQTLHDSHNAELAALDTRIASLQQDAA